MRALYNVTAGAELRSGDLSGVAVLSSVVALVMFMFLVFLGVERESVEQRLLCSGLLQRLACSNCAEQTGGCRDPGLDHSRHR